MYIPQHNAFFIHIPKTGGNSVEFYFLQQMNIKVNDQNSVKIFNDHPELIIGRKNATKQTAHYTAKELQDIKEYVDSTYKFSMVRHPVDRFISECKWNHTGIDILCTQLKEGTNDRLLSSWDYLSVNDQLAVDRVFKLEQIETMNRELSSQFGIDFVLPHYNKSKDKSIKLTTKQLDLVANVWQKDFEEFDYEIN